MIVCVDAVTTVGSELMDCGSSAPAGDASKLAPRAKKLNVAKPVTADVLQESITSPIRIKPVYLSCKRGRDLRVMPGAKAPSRHCLNAELQAPVQVYNDWLAT